jgi:two-component system sensor histidine kinase TctE
MNLELPEVPRGPRSLFGELLDWMLAPLLVIWPVSVFLTWAVAQDIAARPFDHELGESARALAEQVVRQPRDVPGTALAMLRGDEGDLVYFQVLGPRGELLAGERRLPTTVRGTASAGEVRLRNDELGGEPLRVAALWVRPQASAADNEGLLIQVAETLGKRQRMASEIIRGVLLPQFVLLPLAAMLAWLALVRGFKPLDALQQRIRSRAAEDLSPIDEGSAPEEVVPLVRAINDLLVRREDAMQGQKQFLADAAHQLKTPLAGLRTQAELAARAVQSGQATPAEMARSLEQIALASQRAANMVNQLLSLARAEGAAEALATEPIDPRQACARGRTRLRAARSGQAHRPRL